MSIQKKYTHLTSFILLILLTAFILVFYSKKRNKLDCQQIINYDINTHVQTLVFNNNCPIYRISDTSIYNKFTELMQKTPDVQPGEGVSNLSGLWATVYVKPSNEYNENNPTYVVHISGEYELNNNNEPSIVMGFSTISIQSFKNDIITEKKIGSYRKIIFFYDIYNKIIENSNTFSSESSFTGFASAPNTKPIFTLSDDKIFDELSKISESSLLRNIKLDNPIATIWVSGNVNFIEPNHKIKLELFDTFGIIKVYYIQNNSDNVIITKTVGYVKNDYYCKMFLKMFGTAAPLR